LVRQLRRIDGSVPGFSGSTPRHNDIDIVDYAADPTGDPRFV
jgi:hypothetical protein